MADSWDESERIARPYDLLQGSSSTFLGKWNDNRVVPPLLVIAHRSAGAWLRRWRAARVWQRAERAGRIELRWIESVEQAKREALAAARVGRRIGVAGGDGSIRVLAEALHGSSAELAILPAGRGNDLARTLDLPRRCDEALELALHGEATPIDYGIARVDGVEHGFVNGVGIGFDAVVGRRARPFSPGGSLAYPLASVSAWMREPGPWDLAGTIDECRIELQICSASFNNGRTHGGGIRIAPHAEPDDGVLNTTLALGSGRWRLARMLIQVLRGRIETDPRFELGICRSARLSSSQGVPIHADGDSLSERAHQIEIGLKPRALLVVGRTGGCPSPGLQPCDKPPLPH